MPSAVSRRRMTCCLRHDVARLGISMEHMLTVLVVQRGCNLDFGHDHLLDFEADDGGLVGEITKDWRLEQVSAKDQYFVQVT